MTDRELNIALREMARAQGLCDMWYREWTDDSTLDECLERYIRGFDFVLENDYPPLDFIRQNFSRELLHKHNIYLDEKVVINNAKSGFYVFLGDCKGMFVAKNFCAATLYIRNDSVIDVTALGGARVFVRYYDDSGGDTTTDAFSKIIKHNRLKKRG